MLASVGSSVPSGDEWAFEPKYDGIRVLAFADGEAVSLITRNELEKAAQFPEVVDGIRALGKRRKRAFVLDGEIVARKGEDFARFQALQRRIGETDPRIIAEHVRARPATLIAFDLLIDDGDVLIHEPWTERRPRLERLLGGFDRPALRLGDAQIGDGPRILAKAKQAGWEGIIAKRASSVYVPGKRSRDWQKLKLEARQEFVVGGWTEPRKTRQHLGALLLGVYDGDRFVYVGHTGGGFTQQGLAEMYERLKPLERKTPPFETTPATNEPAHWVRPEVVVEVKFNEWTDEGKLRQPIFVGVRDDKDPRSVVREPVSIPKV
jgi:bifunctional non-homologous end joining protein LigD